MRDKSIHIYIALTSRPLNDAWTLGTTRRTPRRRARSQCALPPGSGGNHGDREHLAQIHPVGHLRGIAHRGTGGWRISCFWAHSTMDQTFCVVDPSAPRAGLLKRYHFLPGKSLQEPDDPP